MPQFIRIDTEQIELPSSTAEDKAYVEFKTAFDPGDFVYIQEASTAGEVNLRAVQRGITSWNFTDKEGKPVPITLDAVGHLDFRDYKVLTDQATDMLLNARKVIDDTQKKTSQGGSSTQQKS